ncbi:hypothetical protein AYK26_06915 [Euryarchaeota archaeon SM23-78]|nr:MAG: hypothetical protein AYK26_06915 [Euryarchaeota archaeon SM23-78]
MSKINLNLGCGIVYKPNYINIDKFDNRVADEICDVGDLSFEPCSVDLIEASQLVEHFDYIHCKYILSEWFRVLKPFGKLVLETPDLEMAFKKFVSSDWAIKRTTLQWIYGIDSPGMQHKTGFTFNLLKNLLQEIGFEKISSHESMTHRYEPGIRVVCQKPKNYLKKQVFSCFRKRILDGLEIQDSFILIPLEKWIDIFLDLFEKLEENNEAFIDKIISKTVLCNPMLPIVFIDECVKHGLLKKSDIKEELCLLDFLNKEEFHKKVYSLWVKRKKELAKPEAKSNFILELEKLILGILHNRLDYKESLGYIINLKPTETLIFDFSLVFLEAKKLFNLGVKQFHKRDFSRAMLIFTKSSRLNPDNPLVYWNMARLDLILKSGDHAVIRNYEQALSLIKNKANKLNLKKELKQVNKGRQKLIPEEPVPEFQKAVK